MKIPTEVMSLIGILSGISSLIFSGVTWKMTNEMKHTPHTPQVLHNKNHTHKDMLFIPILVRQGGITKMTLKRLDEDVGMLFEDLGESYKRKKPHPEESMFVKVKRKKTYEKIRDNTRQIENVYKNLNSRVIAVRRIADRNTKEIEKTRMFLKNHGRNVSET